MMILERLGTAADPGLNLTQTLSHTCNLVHQSSRTLRYGAADIQIWNAL